MKNLFLTLSASALLLAACNSNRNADGNDTIMTDTSMVDTMATDAGSMDTAIVPMDTITDTPGVGSTPAPQP